MGKINVASMASVVDEEGMLWLSDCHINSLFKFDIKTKQLKFVGNFEDVLKFSYYTHGKAYACEDEVIFIPFFSKKINVYNKKKKEFLSIKIPVQESVLFQGSDRIENSIYIVSNDLIVWEYEIEKKVVLKNSKLTSICEKFALNTQKAISVKCCSGEMILFEKGGKKGCRINLKTLEVTDLLTAFEQDFELLSYDGEYYWFFFEKSLDVVSWDGKQIYKVYKSSNEEWINSEKKLPYSEIKNINGHIFILNYYAKYIMKVNKEKQMLEQAFPYPSDFKVLRYDGYGRTFMDMHALEKNIVFVPVRGNMLFLYDLEKQNIEGIKLELEKKEIPRFEQVLQCKMKKDLIKEEEGILEIDDLINECSGGNHQNKEQNLGQTIWCKCKS